ncbi:MAG: hypothetical protein IJ214_01990 [Clostridia bacterium]|nr:hypothetical protein [Clostridia bacterium]
MKKWLSFCLCLVLLPVICGAEDTSQTDIAALMARQVSGNSTLRTQLTAELSEAVPSFLDAGRWQSLRAAAADTAVETAYIFSRAGETLGNSQAVITLKRGDEALSVLRVSGRGEQWRLWGDALGDTALGLPRDTSLLFRDRYLTLAGWGAVLLRGLGFTQAQVDPPVQGQWPSLYRFIAAAFTETDAWKEQAGSLLSKYTDQISSWMQEKTRLYLIMDSTKGMGTQSEIKLEGSDLAEEALALLDMFYHDSALLALLRDRMTEAEAQSYLEPGMLLLYEQVLRNMELPEKMVFSRLYDHDGALERTTLRLPLADGGVLVWEMAGDTNTYGLEKDDSWLRVSVNALSAGSWQGDFSVKQAAQSYAGQYQLFVSMEPVYEDENADGRERRQNGVITLLITPAADESLPSQTLTLTVSARAGLANDQPAHWNADLDWQEADTGAYAHIALKTRTGAAIQQAEAPENTLDLAQADDQTRRALMAQVLAHYGQLLPAAP